MASPFREHQTHLSFGDLIGELQEVLRQFPDKRTGSNITYSMEDVAGAAFSVCFTQSPSFLSHQIALTETQGNSNAQTLFGIQKIPTDNPIREMLDPVPPQQVFPMFERVFAALYERGQLQAFHAVEGHLLAFLLHTILDMTDAKYPLIRAKLPSRKLFFQHIQALTCYRCFENFDALLDFMLHSLRIDLPDTS